MEIEIDKSNFVQHFSIIKDYRREQGKRHKLIEIIIIAVCGVICNANSWAEIELYGKEKEDWLKTFLELPHGIPSHDTFGAVFSRIKPEEFQKSFVEWARSIQARTEGETIAIDGKTVRGSFDSDTGQNAIHLVSAWATENSLVLGQVKTDDKSNEITAIPKLLDMINIKGCTVSIDALGCQKSIAEKIIEEKGDYVLALKGNHSTLFDDTKWFFDESARNKFKDVEHSYFETTEKNHGRIETRKYWVVTDLSWFEQEEEWKNLHSICKVDSTRIIKNKKTVESRYYLSSLKNDKSSKFAEAIRNHWGIENSLHWVLDVIFDEDKSRIRKDFSPQNMAMLKKISLNLLRKDTLKMSINRKRLKAGWTNDFLKKVLFA